MTRYLQLRVHSLQCVQETQNRQNFLGIPLEVDPDSIDISAITLDAANGLVVHAPTVFLGNRYRSGTTERFATPKVIAEAPVSDTDVFPRRLSISLNMAEKDDGAGFGELMDGVARELAQELGDRVGDELGDDIAMSDLYDRAEDTVADILTTVFREIGDLLGLGDDPFVPVTIACELARAADGPPSGLHTVEFREPNPQHHGAFILTYGWNMADRRALEAPASPGTTGVATGALKGAGAAAVPYPLPFRTYRFRRPIRKPAAKPGANVPSVKPPVRFRWWQPTPTRLFGGAAKTK